MCHCVGPESAPALPTVAHCCRPHGPVEWSCSQLKNVWCAQVDYPSNLRGDQCTSTDAAGFPVCLSHASPHAPPLSHVLVSAYTADKPVWRTGGSTARYRGRSCCRGHPPRDEIFPPKRNAAAWCLRTSGDPRRRPDQTPACSGRWARSVREAPSPLSAGGPASPVLK